MSDQSKPVTIDEILKRKIGETENMYQTRTKLAINKIVMAERIKTATYLAKKSVDYGKNDPVIDLDRWATPHSLITDHIKDLIDGLGE